MVLHKLPHRAHASFKQRNSNMRHRLNPNALIIPTGSWLMNIPSSCYRRRSLLPQTAPQSLAKTIARDETNMSTFECTHKPPGD